MNRFLAEGNFSNHIYSNESVLKKSVYKIFIIYKHFKNAFIYY